MIKNENVNKPIENILEIIDTFINNQNEEKMIDYFKIIYDAIQLFMKKMKRKILIFMNKHKKKKLNISKIH